MDKKYQYLVIGLLVGLILSALLVLVINPATYGISHENKFLIIPTLSPARSQPAQASNEGKINLNNCTAQDLEPLPGIGPAKAEAIINFRSKYGDFQALDELLYVPGIGNSLFKQIVGSLYIGD